MMSVLRRSCHAILNGPVCAVLLTVLSVGCRDAEGDPVALILAGDAEALALGEDLRTLPDLAARAGVTPDMRGALDLWESSWDEEPSEGTVLRREAYERAAPELARVLGVVEARRLSSALGEALDAIAAAEPLPADPRIEAGVRRASALHERLEAALEGSEVDRALVYAMEASDALREVSPAEVVRSLVSRAEAALASGESLTDQDQDRVARLIEGAESALAARDWSRAIQRAFYASRLLEP